MKCLNAMWLLALIIGPKDLRHWHWYVLGRALSLSLLLLLLCLYVPAAFAQAGSNQWTSWSTVRSGGQAVTTFQPHPGIQSPHIAPHIRPSDIGASPAATRTIQPSAGGAGWVKPNPIMVPYANGSTALATAATRTATRQQVIKAVGTGMRLTSPLGWALVAGSLYSEFYNWDGTLKTSLKPEESVTGSTYAPTMVHQWRCVSCFIQGPGYAAETTGYVYSSPAAACQAANPSGVFYGYWGAGSGTSTFVSHSGTSNDPCLWNTSGNVHASGSSSQQGGDGTPTCPSGGTLTGGVCVLPSSVSCPAGHSAMLQPLSDEYKCAPLTSGDATYAEVDQEGAEALAEKIIGTDSAKMGELLDNIPANTPIETSSTASVTGPSSVTAAESTVPHGTEGGTKTTQTVNNVTYNNNIATVTQTITNIYKDAEGNVTSTEETEPEPIVVDGNLPVVPDFYTQKYPDGLNGVWEEKRAALSGSAFAGLLTTLKPNWGDAGDCPSFSMPGPVLGLDLGGNFAPPCTLWPILRLVFIVSALFAARRIIFGG